MEVARVNQLEFPSEEALNEFDKTRKRGVGSVNPYASIQLVIKTGPTSLLAINVFANMAAAEAAIPHRKKFIEENGFKEEWYMYGQLFQHYVNHLAGKLIE